MTTATTHSCQDPHSGGDIAYLTLCFAVFFPRNKPQTTKRFQVTLVDKVSHYLPTALKTPGHTYYLYQNRYQSQVSSPFNRYGSFYLIVFILFLLLVQQIHIIFDKTLPYFTLKKAVSIQGCLPGAIKAVYSRHSI